MLASKKSDDAPIQTSSKKSEALKELSKLGIKLSVGSDYVLRDYALPGTTLVEVRKRLSSIKSSLSEDIFEERNR